ncbi:MAG: hypothetical protein AAF915_14835 [Cyanobacteria bacterium P01_D01_bin.50]
MTVAIEQDNLQLLANNLQEHLRADVPSGEFFSVKCAVKNHQMMILIQYPQGVVVDTENIFTVIEEALRNNSHEYQQEKAEIFLRVLGIKIPYAKRSLILEKHYSDKNQEQALVHFSFSDFEDSSIPESRALTPKPINSSEDDEIPPLQADSKPKFASFNIKLILLSLVGVIVSATLGGAYVATRPCLITMCQELQTAQYLNNSYGKLIQKINSDQELARLQRKIDVASKNLDQIPGLSVYSQESQQLKLSLSDKSDKIQQIFTASQAARIAGQTSFTSSINLKKLQDRQRLWRQAIAPLETINPNSGLYPLAQKKLTSYRANLLAVNQQLRMEDRWLKKITSAKAVSIVAQKRETTAKSLKDWQKVESTWQVAVNALTPIPFKSSAYSDAQKLIFEYKPRLLAAKQRTRKELMAAKTYKQAVNAVNIAKRYERQNDWQAAVTTWQTALNTAKRVASNSLYNIEAQKLIEPVSYSLSQAQGKLEVYRRIQKTRSDLNRTCSGEIRICTYIINNQGVSVRITPDYEQSLQENLMEASIQGDANIIAGVNNHLQILQQALEAISENADVPLIVYDAQANVIYERTLN